MRKLIAMLLCLCLLLCGCGGNEAAPAPERVTAASIQSAAEESTSTSVQSLQESALEEPSVHEDGGPTDPEELAKWVWAMADETSEAAYAHDFDLSMLMEMDINGDYTSTQSSMRVKEIMTDTETISYSSSQSDGLFAEEWYADGMYYQVSHLGSFKTPMTLEEYQAQEEETASSSTVTDLYAEDFGKLFAVRNDNGYGVTFSEPTLDTWMAFADMFTSEDQESATCQAFNLEGFMQVDPEGNVTQLKMEMQVTLDIMGTPMSMSITVNQLTMGYNDEVVIEVPSDDPSFVDLPDMTIPALILTSKTITDAMPALQYQTAFAMTLVEEAGVQLVLKTDDIRYLTDENGLSVLWNTTENINGEDTYVCQETFSDGQGLITDTSGETTYTLTDEDMLEIISEQTSLYAQSFPYGSNFQTATDGSYATLTYDLSTNYVETTVLDYLTLYGVDSLMTEGAANEIYGTACIWFDASGLMISQLNSLTVEVEMDGVPVSISIQLACDVLAMGDSVVLE